MRLRSLVAGAAAIGALLAAGVSGPAAAGTVTPAAAMNCKTAPSKRIGVITSLYTSTYYYGYAEWLQGTSGSCYKREWVAVHVRRQFNAYANESDRGQPSCMFGVTIARTSDASFYTRTDWEHSRINDYLSWRVNKGTYRTLALYSPNNTLHAWPCGAAEPDGGHVVRRLFFGHKFTHQTWYD